MKTNYKLLVFSLLVYALQPLMQVSAQTISKNKGTINGKKVWTTCPFDYQVFIENKGQYDGKIKSADPILYAARTGNAFAYFTTQGVVYRYDEFVNKDGKTLQTGYVKKGEQKEEEEGKGDEYSIDNTYYLSATWERSNADVSITADGKLSSYFTFPLANKATAKTSGYKTITYHNIYPGIDAVYSFISGKEGIEYTLIIHPGAELSNVKIAYEGAKKLEIDSKGDLKVLCKWGWITDHAPVSHYEETNSNMNITYSIVNGNEEVFNAGNYTTSSNTLIIDPWTTVWTVNNPIPATNKGAYDCDYDYYGNVYVYGGSFPYELVKMSPAGAILWTYTTSNFLYQYYGDFAVEKTSGSCFACEGFGANTGAQTDKINNGGVLASTFTATSSSDEDWRMDYDLCDHEIIIAGGGTYDDNQATILDTNLTTSTYVNVLNFPSNSFQYEYHDMYGIALDPEGGFCYMAPALTASSSIDANVLCQMPMPTLVPTNYKQPDGLNFQEVFSIAYVNTGLGNANGMNCMTANENYVFMYDGIHLREFTAATGAFTISATLPGSTSYDWGGIDVDLCDNVYVGNQTDVDIYNASLANTGSITGFPGNVYDVVLGNGILGYGDSTLYVCGDGFVTRIALQNTNPPVIKKSVTKVCGCNCTAKATLWICGAPDTVGVTYKWSNGQTTQTATGLCPNSVDSVSIFVGCGEQFADTVMISNAGLLTVIKAQTSATCVNPGTASVSVSGGTQPYTYLWSTGATTSNVTGLGAGNVCVSITDNTGCQDTVCFIINGSQVPVITVTADTICPGAPATLTATVTGGTAPYNYLWSNGSTTSTVIVTPATTTTYTATTTDANGCSNSTTVQVEVEQSPTVTIAPQNDSICPTQTATLTATAGPGNVTYLWNNNATTSSITVSPSVTTGYSVTVTNSFGCTATANTTVYMGEPPTINVTATKISFCQGGSTTLIASATNTTTPFTWQPGNLSGPSVSVSPTVTTTYTVTVSSNCGTATATITINVNNLPDPAFSADVRNGCSPLCIQFRDNSTSTSGKVTQWSWNFGNGDTALTKSPIYCYPASGNYDVNLTVVSDSGCSATLDVADYITVYSHPIAAFTMSPQPTNVLAGTIQFTDQSTDAYGLSYWTWNFGVPGNDTLSNLENPSYTYWDTGTYCPSMVVMNIHGCVDTVTNCLIIDPIFTLYIPDAFSPDGNGLNGVFMAKGNDVKTFEMYIFDRWGMELFHSTDINDGWDGTVKGGSTVCQEDTYVYLINATDNKNKVHKYIGKVNLIK